MHKKEWSLGKKIIVGIIVFAVIFALIIGVIYVAILSNRGSVMVIPVSEAVAYDYDESDMGIDGYVSMGDTQNIMKDAGKVSKVYVSVGDYVEKGATLIQFDTKTEDLALKQAEINLESRKLDLSRAQSKLDMLNAATPYVEPPAPTVEPTNEDAADGADATENTNAQTEGEKAPETPTEPVVVNYSGEQLYSLSNGEIYSETELRKEKNTQNAAIASANTEIKACQQNIEAAKKTLEKRKAVAEFNGYVTKLNIDSDEEEKQSEEQEENVETDDSAMVTDANQENILLQVSSKEGLFLKSYISEWKKEKYKKGDTVYAMDWRDGSVYEASIIEISDQPSESVTERLNQWMGDSSTYYPFTARINAEGTQLSSGDYLDVYFSNPQSRYSDSAPTMDGDTISIIKAFIRVDNGRKYVYARGENGLLEKRYIKTDGQTRNGYIVTEGLSMDDYIAFPYGKDVRNGAQVREGSISELYNY